MTASRTIVCSWRSLRCSSRSAARSAPTPREGEELAVKEAEEEAKRIAQGHNLDAPCSKIETKPAPPRTSGMNNQYQY